MRLIDADAIIKKWGNVHCKDVSFEMAIIGAINDVKKAPTVDAMPVIRCKDCVHWNCSDDETYCDELGIFNTDMNSYCSYAKRKEHETD